jgi:hypothetical protein
MPEWILRLRRDAVGSAYGQGQREFKDGVLTVTLPKTQETLSRVKKIKVQRTEVSGRYPEHAAGLVRPSSITDPVCPAHIV